MGEEIKEESGWKKFKKWVAGGVSDVFTKENMNALKMGFNAFLITIVGVGGLFIFSWARKIENELHSIGVMQLWASFATLLGIVIGVFFGSVKKSTEMLSQKTESISKQAGIDIKTTDTSELEEIYADEGPEEQLEEQPNLKVDDSPPNLKLDTEEPDFVLPEIPDQVQ